MSMTASGRAEAIYDKIAMSSTFDELSQGEKDALKAQIELVWGDGDLEYITTNATVEPGSMAVVPSAIVAPPAGGPCSGVGTVATGTGNLT